MCIHATAYYFELLGLKSDFELSCNFILNLLWKKNRKRKKINFFLLSPLLPVACLSPPQAAAHPFVSARAEVQVGSSPSLASPARPFPCKPLAQPQAVGPARRRPSQTPAAPRASSLPPADRLGPAVRPSPSFRRSRLGLHPVP